MTEMERAIKLRDDFNVASMQALRILRSAFNQGKDDELRSVFGSDGFRCLEVYMDYYRQTTAAMEEWVNG